MDIIKGWLNDHQKVQKNINKDLKVGNDIFEVLKVPTCLHVNTFKHSGYLYCSDCGENVGKDRIYD